MSTNKLAKILIVEDERMVRDALRRKLDITGFDVIEAGDGQEALDKAQNEHPQLVLLDLIIPIIDGLTVLEKIRSSDWGKQLPVIILSNLSDAETVDEIKKKGVHDYLVKTDWTLDDVITKVKKVLRLPEDKPQAPPLAAA